jgi:hypothetical protein
MAGNFLKYFQIFLPSKIHNIVKKSFLFNVVGPNNII